MNINTEEYYILKAKYEAAVKEGRETFFFLGHELVPTYAKYLLEYLKPRHEKD